MVIEVDPDEWEGTLGVGDDRPRRAPEPVEWQRVEAESSVLLEKLHGWWILFVDPDSGSWTGTGLWGL